MAVFTGNGLKDPDTAMETEVAISKMSDVEEMRLHLRKESQHYENKSTCH